MLVMRLETAAAKFDRKVAKALPNGYDLNAADMRELLLEAARRIKELEQNDYLNCLEKEESAEFDAVEAAKICGND